MQPDLETNQTIHTNVKRHLHVIVFSVFVVVVSAIMMFGLGDIRTKADRQRGQFLSQDFRNQNPSVGNITYSLFGDGTTGAGGTPYTRTWATSCIASNSVTLPSNFTGRTLSANTIYILNSGNYTLTQNISLGDCSALLGNGVVSISGGSYNKNIIVSNVSHVIIDNITFSGRNNTGVSITGSTDITIHAVQGHSSLVGLFSSGSSNLLISDSQFHKNTLFGIYLVNSNHITLNNVLSYNNQVDGISADTNSSEIAINNSQFYSNGQAGASLYNTTGTIINNSIMYNNSQYGCFFQSSNTGQQQHIHNSSFYNNPIGIYGVTGTINLYGTVKLFDNTLPTSGSADFVTSGTMLGRTEGTIDYSPIMDYDRVTNPINMASQVLFSGATGYIVRGPQTFTTSLQPLRYIFGLNILQQIAPVMYEGIGVQEYGLDGSDFDTTKYIAELLPHFTPAWMSVVSHYFGSGSIYTQNWSGNGCSLGSFQVVSLTGGAYSGTYTLHPYTIYILNSGEYKFTQAGNGFTFGGNCVALIGSGNVRIDKYNTLSNNLISASDNRNLIIENIKVDGKYTAGISWHGISKIGISFAGTTYNTTINQVQSFNHSQNGIFLGIGSHHNTIINTQTYNNTEAGIYFYLASHHNVINNTMTYNNSGYGIRFANGSSRNAMNNFQSFNNAVGIYGDLTTKENIINRAMLYNNSQYGLLLKNSSGNILNDVQIYNNTTGIKVAFSSINNIYNGELNLFDNISNLEGTDGADGYLSNINITPFETAGVLTTGSNLMNCSYVTNPNISGSTTYLLNNSNGCVLTGQDVSVFTGKVTSINYAFGTNIYKQTTPYRYDTNNTPESLPAQFDSGKYIAEIFAIRDTELDTAPSFSFSGTIQPSTIYTSQVYTAQIINRSIPVVLTLDPTAASGWLIINGSRIGTGGTIVNADTVQIALISSSVFSGVVTGTISFNTNAQTAIALLTTRAPNELPNTGSFAFTNITGVALQTYTGSTTIVSGIETGVSASISTGWIAIYSGNTLISSGSVGTVYSGNRVQAMIPSSSQYSSLTTGIVTIGQGSGTFTVSTIPDLTSIVLSFTNDVSSGFVATDTISVLSSGTSPTLYKFISLSGDCTNSGMLTYTGSITVTTEGNNGKYFCAYTQLSGYDRFLVSQYTLHIDSTPPVLPTLTSPINDTTAFFLVLEWTGSYDTGIGLSGYSYEIAADYNFIDIVSTGYVQAANINTGISPHDFLEIEGNFYWRVKAIDVFGLSTTWSSPASFIVVDNENFTFDEETAAELNTRYTSNGIIISGLRTYGLTIASVDTGAIYKNGTNRGQTTYVQNGDTVAIRLTSPSDYDESTESILTVANRSTSFIISTTPDSNNDNNGDCSLSSDDEDKIQIIYDSLIGQYSGDQNKYDQFLYTMRSMLQDQIDLTNDCNLQFLYDLLDSTLVPTTLTGINVTGHIAPNCKGYRVSYSTEKVAYTSPDFKVPTYFANRDALTRYIDSKNPGDCHVSDSTNGTWYFGNADPTKHVTPNGKLYTIQSGYNGYTSAELSSARYFQNIDELRKYLDSKNPPFPIWSHTIDATFTPVSYTAPNDKVYTIYKTSQGYMSYRLLNVRYYPTLESIKTVIYNNNPSK